MGTPRPPFKFSARTRVRFSDTDAQGIVYYGRYNPYFDVARVEYLRSLGLLQYRGGGEFVTRANDVEYFAPARFDDEIEIYAHVSRIDYLLVRCHQGAFRAGPGHRHAHGRTPLQAYGIGLVHGIVDLFFPTDRGGVPTDDEREEASV